MRKKIPVSIITLLLLFGRCAGQSSEPNNQFGFEEPKGNLTLKDAITLTLLNNPELASFSWEVRAQEAKEIQAGLLPNPEIGFETEQIGGTGEFRGLNSAQTTIQVSQLIETAEKRAKRKNVAALEKTLSGWDYETKKLEVFSDVTKTFIDVLGLQERAALEAELVQLSEQVSNAVSERVKAGKVSPLEETKANVALASVKIELERLKSELEAAHKQLGAFWGSATPAFTKVEGDLFDFGALPDANQLAEMLQRNPDIARWTTELKQRKAAVELAKSKAVPDVTLSAGTQYFNNPDDTMFVVGVSIPLPFFDRNQGGIGEAQARLSKGYRENQAAEVKVRTSFAEIYQSLSASYKQAAALKNEIVPGAQSAFTAYQEGYRQGKFGYLDVLDAQRTFFDAKGQYIEVLTSYHKAMADLERLTGQKIESIIK